MRCAIVGAGVLGRVLGLKLLWLGHHVEFFDPGPATGEGSTAYQAGGMLAPFSECEAADPLIFKMGLSGTQQWDNISNKLDHSIGFQLKGSLIVSHPRDRAIWEEVKEKILSQAPPEDLTMGPARDLEEELSENFSTSLFLPKEGVVDPRLFLRESFSHSIKLGAVWHHKTWASLHLGDLKKDFQDFDYVFDTRGIGAQPDQRHLRGVRGEALLVKASDVSISRPVRIMHPRYSLYIVPRQEHMYYLGATQIENDDPSPITVRSSLELLSAAYAVHSGFGEALVMDSCVGIRPAYMNNCPKIWVKDKLVRMNGLYRHGFLLSPILADAAIAHMEGAANIPFEHKLFS